VANEQNLRPGEYKLTLEEQKKGGIASGQARREKATMKKTLEMLLDEKNNKGKTYRELATLGLLKGAVNGNASNYRTILETLGELSTQEQTTTPVVEIKVIDNSNLEKVLYEENRHNKNA
jgi:flagellar biosynthesis chaperone FliJ